MHPFRWKIVVGLLLCSAACHPYFQVTQFRSSEALYAASMRQFNRGKWGDAVSGFDKLTLDLAARDTLLPLAYWYLGEAQQHLQDHLLAAESFGRLFESFPDDSLAPSAALRAARDYGRRGSKVALDPTDGETALDSYGNLLKFYPDKPQADTAKVEVAALEDRFAQKDYNTGMFYFRDKAYDSALIYFRDVIAKYPDSPTARLTALRMLEAFRAIKYGSDASDLCTAMVEKYPADAEVKRVCPAPPPSLPKHDTTLAPSTRPFLR